MNHRTARFLLTITVIKLLGLYSTQAYANPAGTHPLIKVDGTVPADTPYIVINGTNFAFPAACLLQRNFGGDANSRDFGDYAEKRDFGDKSEQRTLGNDKDTRNFGDDSDQRQYGDASEQRQFGDKTDSRSFGDEQDQRQFGGNASLYRCQLISSNHSIHVTGLLGHEQIDAHNNPVFKQVYQSQTFIRFQY